MATKDQRVDAYIERAAPFARPILKYLRKIVHTGCWDVEETIKWQSPFFERKGTICFMAAFKEHCAFGFWKGSLILGAQNKGAMGHFGPIKSIDDLPNEKALIGYVRKAAELNAAGVRKSRSPPRAKQKINVPSDLKAALQKIRKRERRSKTSVTATKKNTRNGLPMRSAMRRVNGDCKLRSSG